MKYLQNYALRCSFRSCLKTVVFSVILMAGAIFPSFLSAQNAMKLTIVNRSGYPDDQVYFIMICQSPLGYLDFRNHVLVETPVFQLDAAAMTATLAQLKSYSGDGSSSIPCPAMGSSRIYFCFGKNFDQMGGFSASGPEMGSSNPIPWDMFEINLSGSKFINQSNVDFFSIAYTLTANPSSGGTITVGIPTASETIFGQFEAIPSPADSAQQYGNTDIFKALIIKNAAGEVVRVISPKAAALGYVNSSATLPQMFTHFLDDYVNNQCWKPNRAFSFSSKLASDTATYYGKVSADGQTLSIYTDAALTIPYTVPSLPRPSNIWGSPDFQNKSYLWHNVGATSAVLGDIDWGYLLFGQDGYPSGPGAYWITDPVAMAIPVSIVRGVMHLDNGTVDWKDSSKYYLGSNGVSSSAFPIFYYGQILHRYGIAGRVYALSFDDIYGNDSGIGFTDPAVTMTIYPFKSPREGDFDGDRYADPYTVVNSSWYIWFSGASYQLCGGPWNFGVVGTPVAGDFDGDGKTDPAMVVNSSWYIWFSGAGYQLCGGPWNFGVVGTPVAGDFDGDGKTDPAMTVNSLWYIWFSGAGYQLCGGPWNFGVVGTPMAGDFDGDGKADPAMVVNNYWTIWMSSGGYAPQGPFLFNP